MPVPPLTVRWPDTDEGRASLANCHTAAAAAGESTEAWARRILATAAAAPIVRQRYTLKATGENGARAHVRREPDGIIGRGLQNATQAQADAYRQAINLVERNGPGDRERAIALLAAEFEDVFETA
jgi:hypothetical protein